MSDNLSILDSIPTQGVSIYGSRDKIRNQLAEYAKKYLNLGSDADIHKTSYLAYIIDVLSILSANHIYYDSTLYKEFFLTDAQLPESVHNLARWIGYNSPKATPASSDVLITIPLTFNTGNISFNIPSSFKLYAGDIPFMLESAITNSDFAMNVTYNSKLYSEYLLKPAVSGTIINNSAVSVRDYNGFNRPIYISSDQKTASFMVKCLQKEIVVHTKYVESSLLNYQFYNIPLTYSGQVSNIEVYVATPTYNQKFTSDVQIKLSSDTTGSNITTQIDDSFNPNSSIMDSGGQWCKFVKWSEAQGALYSLKTGSEEFVWSGDYDSGTIHFGNGIVGKTPPPSSLIVIRTHVTKGTEGRVLPGTIIKGDPLYANSSTYPVSIKYNCINTQSAIGGTDIPSIPEIKNNAIINLRSGSRLVSESDYSDIATVIGGSLPISQFYPVLKRSDIKVNEIAAFTNLVYSNNGIQEIVPTRNVRVDIENPTFNSDGNYTVSRNTPVSITYKNGKTDTFSTLFNMVLNKDSRVAYYDYMVQSLNGYNVTNTSLTDQDNQTKQYCYMIATSTDFNINTGNTSVITKTFPLYCKLNLTHLAAPADNLIVSKVVDSVTGSMDIIINPVTVPVIDITESANMVDYKLRFNVTDFNAKMVTKWGNNDVYDSSAEYGYVPTTITDSDKNTTTYKSFSWRINDYTAVPNGKQRFDFQVYCTAPQRNENGIIVNTEGIEICDESDVWIGSQATSNTFVKLVTTLLDTYSTDVVIRNDLTEYMMSMATVDNTINNTDVLYDVYHIYNVPTILTQYYTSIIQSDSNNGSSNFELQTIQALMSGLQLSSKRMLTDFINIKLCDTYGPLTNLKYNKSEYIIQSRHETPWLTESLESIGCIRNPDYSAPLPTQSGVYYIANAKIDDMSNTSVNDYIGYIFQRLINSYSDPSDPSETIYQYEYKLIKPQAGMYVKIQDELSSDNDIKTCVWTGNDWLDTDSFEIPMTLSIRVETDSKVAMSDSALKESIITNLTEYFSSKIGIQKNLDRSDIIRVVRSVEGVTYCDVTNPPVDIRFDYEIGDLTQKQLLEYTPQYIGFRGYSSDTGETYSNSTISIEIVRT